MAMGMGKLTPENPQNRGMEGNGLGYEIREWIREWRGMEGNRGEWRGIEGNRGEWLMFPARVGMNRDDSPNGQKSPNYPDHIIHNDVN